MDAGERTAPLQESGDAGRRALAVIPARGGSKGIPRKNIRTVGGAPLIVRTVRAARTALRVERVVVSTDDGEIAGLAGEAGAEVVWRPAEFSGDLAPSEKAVLHALAFLREAEAYSPEAIVFLQCTSPFTVSADIDGVLELVLEKGYDTAFTATKSHGFLWREEREHGAIGINHDKRRRLMRQQRETEYLETGAAYAMRTEGFLEVEHRFFGKTGIYEVPHIRSLEIDDMEDLEVANALCDIVDRGEMREKLPAEVKALVMDFDGVLTDNQVLVHEDGGEAVLCNRGDGLGIRRLQESGVRTLILSTERNPVVRVRASKLGVPFLQGTEDKLPVMKKWLEGQGIALSETVYVGNDVNDKECLMAAGCGVCVADGAPEARIAADFVLPEKGGRGAVRLLCELILERNKHGRLG